MFRCKYGKESCLRMTRQSNANGVPLVPQLNEIELTETRCDRLGNQAFRRLFVVPALLSGFLLSFKGFMPK